MRGTGTGTGTGIGTGTGREREREREQTVNSLVSEGQEFKMHPDRRSSEYFVC